MKKYLLYAMTLVACLRCGAAIQSSGDRLRIEANRGQFPKSVEYVARLGSLSAGIKDDGIEFLNNRDRFSVRFVGGAAPHCTPASSVESETNYLALNPAITHVPEYAAVLCANLYQGIDWRLHISKGQLEHDWEIAPGANVSSLAMELDQKASAQIRPDGALEIRSGETAILWKQPVAWQEIGNRRVAVAVSYRLRGRRLDLAIGPHQLNQRLVIDPVIDFSYMIGSGAGDFGCQVAVDSSGNIYLAGLAVASGFQLTPGAAVQTPVQNGDLQIFVRKLAPDGATVLYSTFLGAATNNSDHPIGMRVDSAGDVFLAADIFSAPLPITGTPIDPNGSIGVYKLSPAGDRLLYATRVLPTGYSEEVALAIDASGYAYVASGGTNPAVSKIDPLGKTQIFLYKPYTGNYSGSLADIALGPDGSIYLAGTNSDLSGIGSDGTVATPGALQTAAVSGSIYGWLLRIKPDGNGLIYGTYIETDAAETEGIHALAVDSSGAAYVGGYAASDPVLFDGVGIAKYGIQANVLGAYSPQPHDTNAFVMKVNPQGSVALFTDLVPGSSVAAISVDGGGNIYTAGPFNTGSGVYNASAFPNMSGVNVLKIDPSGQNLLYDSAIPFGAPAAAYVNQPMVGMTVDLNGAAYITGGSATAQMPQAQDIPAMASGAYLLKVDAVPLQCDLAVSVASVPSGFTPPAAFHPGQIPIVFTITNNGPAPANDVVFSVSKDALTGGPVVTCTGSDSGICTDDWVPVDPRVSFASIAPGASETVTITINPYISPLSAIQMTPLVSTSTSDINQSNNSVTAVVPVAWVPVTAHSFLSGGAQTDLKLQFSVNGYTAPPTIVNGVEVYPTMAQPGSQVQIGWTSPQVTGSGDVVVFQQWADGNKSNPRTFTASGSTLTENAIFEKSSAPSVSTNGVVSAAKYSLDGVSPGEIVSLFGLNLGAQAIGQVVNGAFTTSLGGLAVSFDGAPAPLVYTGGTQASVVVPYGIAGKSFTTMTVAGGGSSTSVQLPVVAADPALFTADASGRGPAAALNQDGTINSMSNPAHPGDVIVLYGTGEGAVTPVPADGTISSSPAPVPILPVTVNIAGQIINPLYAAEAPGLTAGVIQINARIPNIVYQGPQWPVSFTVGAYLSGPNVSAGYPSQNLTIFVQ